MRISTNQESAWALMMGMLWPVIMVAVLAIGLSALLAGRMAKNIVEPLNELDMEHPLKNDAYEEISPLLHRIHRQHRQIAEQMDQLKRKADEFRQITSHMQEGLVLLDSEGAVLSINPAARSLFEAEDDCIGKHFLTIDRASIDPREVVLEPQVVFNYNVARSFKEWATGAPTDEAVICTVDTAQVALDLVSAGLGITFAPNECVENHPGVRYVSLKNWHQALYMCILYDKWLEPPVWEFIEAVVKGFRGKQNKS